MHAHFAGKHMGAALSPLHHQAALFGPIPGLLADRFHSYVPASALFALCLAGSLGILQRAYRKLDAGHRPRRD